MSDQNHLWPSAASHASSALRCTGWQWNIQGGFNEWHIAKSLVIIKVDWLYLCKYRFYEKKKIDLLLFLEPYQYECYDGS